MSQHTEQVVLLDNHHKPIGLADKATIHDQHTPYHLAFSCYLFNSSGQLLLTRRALSKIAWPGTWTNSFCGHPLPEEDFTVAIERRAMDELGATVTDVTEICGDFSYRAVDRNGIVENEFCPVYGATLTNELTPHPEEVMDWAWCDLEAVLAAIQRVPFMFSPWMVDELKMASLLTRLQRYSATFR